MAGPAMTADGDQAWIDVSVTVRHGMPHWPDNPPIVMQRPMELLRGHACNLSHLAMGVHTGTHIDAPVHFIHQAAGVDEMPLAATMGPARVIEIADPRRAHRRGQRHLVHPGRLVNEVHRRVDVGPGMHAHGEVGEVAGVAAEKLHGPLHDDGRIVRPVRHAVPDRHGHIDPRLVAVFGQGRPGHLGSFPAASGRVRAPGGLGSHYYHYPAAGAEHRPLRMNYSRGLSRQPCCT